eukprot:492517_1
MREIDFEQAWGASTELYGEWNWTSFQNMLHFHTLDIDRNAFYGTISGDELNLLASLPLRKLNVGRTNFEINFTDISNLTFPLLEDLYLRRIAMYGTLNTSINGFFSKFPKATHIYADRVDITNKGVLLGHFESFDCISSVNLPDLKYFEITKQNFSGSLIMSPGYSLQSNFRTFEIDSNNFSGTIDWNIFSGLYSLSELNIQYNRFTGIINWTVISDLVVNGSLRVIELDGNKFEQAYVDFSWIPHDIDGFILKLDLNINCDPEIYQCVPANRSFEICYNKTHCESSCQCSAEYTEFYTTNNELNNLNSTICSDEYSGYIELIYQMTIAPDLCIEGELFVDLISEIIYATSITYRDNDFIVYTVVITKLNKYFDDIVCDNVSLTFAACFDQQTNEIALVKLSKTNEFQDELNEQILIYTNQTIVTVFIVDVVIVYLYHSTQAAIPTIPTIPTKPFIGSPLFGIISAVCFLLICTLSLFLYVYYNYKKKLLQQQVCYVSNALVVIITIGDYETEDQQTDADIDCDLNDMPVYKDAETLTDLFSFLKYKIIPPVSKTHWTAEEIIAFFRQDLGNELFDDNILKYDCLMVFFSCHGVPNRIITSDYKTIDKILLHRIVSCRYPETRNIPRIFIWDSCEGNAHKSNKRSSLSHLPSISLTSYTSDALLVEESKISANEVQEMDKGVKLNALNIPNDKLWSDDKYCLNPDYNLAELNACAANTGFQAKLDLRFGSYLTYYFVEKMKKNIQEKECKSLGQICHEIQDELHDLGKQQTIHILNNQTEYLQFKMNDKIQDKITVELMNITT